MYILYLYFFICINRLSAMQQNYDDIFDFLNYEKIKIYKKFHKFFSI